MCELMCGRSCVCNATLICPFASFLRFDLKLGESHGVEETVSKNFTYCAEFSAATDITGLYLTGKELCGGVGAVGGLWGGMICIFSLSKNRMIEYVNSCW